MKNTGITSKEQLKNEKLQLSTNEEHQIDFPKDLK